MKKSYTVFSSKTFTLLSQEKSLINGVSSSLNIKLLQCNLINFAKHLARGYDTSKLEILLLPVRHRVRLRESDVKLAANSCDN